MATHTTEMSPTYDGACQPAERARFKEMRGGGCKRWENEAKPVGTDYARSI